MKIIYTQRILFIKVYYPKSNILYFSKSLNNFLV